MMHQPARRSANLISKCLSVRYFTPPSSEYGLEKKWAYYNQEAIESAAAKPLIRLTPYQMLYVGKFADGKHLIKSAQYLHKELPKRVARRIMDFQNLPYIAAINPIMQDVYELYLRAFYKLNSFKKIETLEDEIAYSNLVRQLLDDHKDVVTSLAKAFQQVNKKQVPYELLGTLVERTLTSRLGIRMLAEHHIGLRNERERYIGIISTHLKVKNLIERCAFYCRQLCEHNYGVAPAVNVSGHINAVFPYIPAPLEYMLQELLKNAMKALVLHHGDKSHDMPPINVTICNNDGHFVIKVSDRGGGISDSRMQNVFKYAFSTTQEEEMAKSESEGGAFDNLVKRSHLSAVGGAMSGYGFGLPTTRAYAQFLGGSLDVISLYGLGTDVFLKLSHIIGKNESFRI